MSRIDSTIARLAVCAALCLPASAFAQFSVSLTLTPTGPATCDATGITLPATGFETLNLPNSSGNVADIISVNGGAPLIQIETLPGPFPLTFPSLGSLMLSGPGAPFTMPYTIVESAFPALNGAPTGIGVRVTGVCTVSGATVTIENDVLAPAPPALPMLPTWGLAMMSALLAATGLWMARRRQRDI